MPTFVGEPFACELRNWRTRRGLSQLELAIRAGTTQRHVSFIERGRSLPGRGMVVRLAEALEVPLRERNTMLLAAGYAPAYRQTSLDDPELDPVRGALERILDGYQPYPAVITDRAVDLVSCNAAFTTLTHFATATDVTVSELTLEAFIPGDAFTAGRLGLHS